VLEKGRHETPCKHEPAAVAAADLAMPGPISVPRIAGGFIPAPLTALQPAIVFGQRIP
jgi:hypothetical protein